MFGVYGFKRKWRSFMKRFDLTKLKFSHQTIGYNSTISLIFVLNLKKIKLNHLKNIFNHFQIVSIYFVLPSPRMSIFPKRNTSWTLDGNNLFVMLLKFTTIISPLVNFAIGACFSTKVVIRIRYKGAIPMVGPFESLGGKLKSFYVVMVKANLPTSTTQNPWSILSTMWNTSSNVTRLP